MKQIAFMAPAPQQYSQAVLSSFLTSKNIGIIVLAFAAALIILFFAKFLKSFLIKIIIALIIAGITALYLYFTVSSQIRF